MRPITQPASLTLMPGPLAEVSGAVVVHGEEASSSIWTLHTTVLPLAYSNAANVGPPHDPRRALRLQNATQFGPCSPVLEPPIVLTGAASPSAPSGTTVMVLLK